METKKSFTTKTRTLFDAISTIGVGIGTSVLAALVLSS
jgi:hypothetical protein